MMPFCQTSIRPSFWALVVPMALVLGGCPQRPTTPTRTPAAQERLMHSPGVAPPSLSRQAVTAGMPVTLNCAAGPEDGALQVGRPALFPDAPLVALEGDQATFVPTQAGSYTTQCVHDRDGTYAAGPTLVVLAAAPRSLTVQVQEHTVPAGGAVRVGCAGMDAFGNRVELPEATGLSGQQTSYLVAGERAELNDRGELPISGRLGGAVAVQCHSYQWPYLNASEPQVIEVTPAPLVALTAEVDGMFYGAHEPVAVRCMGQDAFGNSRPVTEALVQVLDAGATLNGQTFFADKSGSYRVLCTLAEALEPDGAVAPALTSAPTEVRIEPGPPARWQVRWDPPGECLSQTTPLPLVWRVLDAYGNRVDADDAGVRLQGYDAQLVTEPATRLQRNNAGLYKIDAVGAYTLQLRAVGPGTERLPVWEKEVLVNSTPPQIVMTSPKRAAMVQGASEQVMLTGYVKSAFGPLTDVMVNGTVLHEAAGRQSFDFEIPFDSRWGLNIVRGKARDACGNESILTQSFLKSEAFGPVTTHDDEAGRVPHAVRARFGQATWDDGDPDTLQDVATLMQMALKSSSLEDRLPHHLGAYPQDTGTGELPEGRMGWTKPFRGKINGVEVFRDGPLKFKKPTIEYLTASDGGWDVAFTLEDLAVPFVANQWTHWGLMGSGLLFVAKGSLETASMRVDAHIDVFMQDGLPQAQVDPDQLHVTFAEGAPELHLALPGDNRIFAGKLEQMALHLFRNLPQSLVPIIEERVRKEMIAQMNIFLRGLELHHSLPLPPPFETNLQVISGLDAIELRGPKGAGYGDFGLFTQIVAPQKPLEAPRHAPFTLPEPLLGPIRRNDMPRVPLSLNGNQSFALAVHDDLLNQMLYALWAGGAFNLQVTAHGPTEVNGEGNGPEAAPSPPGLPTPGTTMLDAANVDVFFLSPPVVMPSDNDNEIVLGIGDVWARVERFSKETASRFPPEPLRAGFFCSTIIRAHIDIDAEHGHLVLTPLDPPELYLELNPVEPAAMTAAVHHWLSKNLKSMLLRRMSETLRSFPLPQLAIGRIPGVPQEAVWVPDTGTLDRPAHGAEVVVQGTLRDARAEAPEGFVP